MLIKKTEQFTSSSDSIPDELNQWETASYSCVGERAENQDRELLITGEKGVLAVVADGMGGHKDGGIAAEKLIGQAKLWYADKANNDLSSIIHKAHQELNSQDFLGTSYSPENAPRTTGVILWIHGEHAEVVHVGDSRCYRFHSSKLVTRTLDHSIVQLLVLSGEVAEEEMGTHPDQNRLTQSIGGENTPRPSYEKFEIKKGDAFILCSDGFWEYTTEKEMSELLDSDDLQQALEQRSNIAVERAADKADNTTAIAIKLSNDDTLPSLNVTKKMTNVGSEQVPSKLSRWWGIALIVFVILMVYLFYNGEEPTLPEDQNQLPTDENVIVPKIEPARSNIEPSSEDMLNLSPDTPETEDRKQPSENKNMLPLKIQPARSNTKPSSEDMPNLSPEDKPDAQDKAQPEASIIDESRIEIVPDSDIVVEDGNEAVEKVIELLRERERLSEGSTLILSDLEPDSRADGGKNYRAKQWHKDILIDKIGVVIEVDESGKLLRVNSEAINIDDDIVLEPEITWEEAITRWLDENDHARYKLIEEPPETVIHVENDTGIRLAYKLVIQILDESDNLINNITLYLSAQNGGELSRYSNIIH